MPVFSKPPLPLSPGGPAVPSIVQQITYNSEDSNSTAINGNNFVNTLPNPVQAGNALIVVAYYESGRTPTISDTVNGTWGAGHVSVGTTLTCAIFSKFNVAAGITAIQLALSSTTVSFQWQLFEVCNLTGLSANQPPNAQDITGPALSIGSFTPSNNNANGGNWILSFFAADGPTTGAMTDNWIAGSGQTLLQAYGGPTFSIAGFHINFTATQAILQTTAQAINPSITCSGDSTDPFNTIGVAFTVGSTGSPRPTSGLYVNGITHVTFPLLSAAGTQVILCPFTGTRQNLRVVGTLEVAAVITSVTDSDGNTWTGVAANPSQGSSIYYVQNNPATSLTTSLSIQFGAGGNGSQFSLRIFDISGAANSAYDTSAFQGSISQVSHTFTDNPIITPGVSKGITIATSAIGQGPGTSVTSPSGAYWDLISYTNETDSDGLDNADLCGHLFFASNATQHWNWTTGPTSTGPTNDGIAATFASA